MIVGGPNVVNDNLVFNFDAHNAKSYPGEPVTNRVDLKNIRCSYGDDSLWDFFSAADQINSAIKWSTTDGIYKMVIRTATNLGLGIVIPATVSASTSYLFSVRNFIRSRTAAADDRGWLIRFYDASDNIINNVGGYYQQSTSSSAPGPSNGVVSTVTSVSFTTPSNTVRVEFYVGYGGSPEQGDAVRFEHPMVTETSYITPFVKSTVPGDEGTYSSRPKSAELVVHSNVGSGSTFVDSSPWGHTLTTEGSVTRSSSQSKFGSQSIYFGTYGDSIKINDSSAFNVGSNDFTVDGWMYCTTATDYAGLWTQGGTSGHYQLNNCEISSTRKLRWLIRNTSSTLLDLSTNASIFDLNTWNHFAFIRDGSRWSIYLNGVRVATTTGVTGSIEDLPWHAYIGNRHINGSAGYQFYGYLDEIRFTNGHALWVNDFDPPTRRAANGGIIDISRNGCNGNLMNMVGTGEAHYRNGKTIRLVSGNAGATYVDFDGSDDKIQVGNIPQIFNGSVSMESWFFWNDDTRSIIFGNYNQGAGGHDVNFEKLTSGSLRFYWNRGERDVSTAANVVTTSGEWQHIVMVRDVSNNNFRFYVNGSLIQTTSNAGSNITSTGSTFRIGADTRDGTTVTNGGCSTVRLYSIALTDAQVLKNYNATKGRFGL